jgi:hypothetical protein
MSIVKPLSVFILAGLFEMGGGRKRINPGGWDFQAA